MMRVTSSRWVEHYQNPAQCIHTQGQEPLLTHRIRIFNGDSFVIPQRLLRI